MLLRSLDGKILYERYSKIGGAAGNEWELADGVLKNLPFFISVDTKGTSWACLLYSALVYVTVCRETGDYWLLSGREEDRDAS